MPRQRDKPTSRKFPKSDFRVTADEFTFPFAPRWKPKAVPVPGICDAPCACIRLNCEWRPHILGVLDVLAYDDAWLGTPDEKLRATREVMALMAAIGSNCGCDQQPTNQRFNDDGLLEWSFDGGQTWEVRRDQDPRFTAPLSPPLPGVDGNNKKCDAAASGVAWLQNQVAASVAENQAWSSISALAAVVVAILVVIGIIGTGGILAPLLLELASVMFAAGITAFEAAFTQAVWDDLKCILYCNMQPDASFTEAGWFAVKEQAQAALPALPGLWLTRVFTLIGPVGLTNAVRTQLVTGADCSACSCSCQGGCTATDLTFQWDNPDWLQHGQFTRYFSETPIGQFDSFDMAGTAAILSLGELRCVQAVKLSINNGCGEPGFNQVNMRINGVTYPTLDVDDTVGCNQSVEWLIPAGVITGSIRFEQVTPKCPTGNDNMLICAIVTVCE